MNADPFGVPGRDSRAEPPCTVGAARPPARERVREWLLPVMTIFTTVGFPIRNHYPRFRGAPPSPSYHTFNSHSFGGFGLKSFAIFSSLHLLLCALHQSPGRHYRLGFAAVSFKDQALTGAFFFKIQKGRRYRKAKSVDTILTKCYILQRFDEGKLRICIKDLCHPRLEK